MAGELTLTNCALTSTRVAITGAGVPLIDTMCQYSLPAPAWPSWNDLQGLFASSILNVDVYIPGNPPYTGYTSGLFGEARLGIGACFFDIVATEFYADLDLAGTGGSGTEINPWTADDFKTVCADNLVIPDSTIYIKGMHDYGETTFTFYSLDKVAYLRNWLPDAPWRIKAEDILFLNEDVYNINCFNYFLGIFEASPGSITINGLQVFQTCFLRASGIITINGDDISSYYGCTIITPEIHVEIGEEHGIPRLFDSILDVGVFTGGVEGVVSQYCLYSCAVPGTMHDYYQELWTPPLWPPWNAAKEGFNNNILSGVLTPPEPGMGTQPTGLFGEPRLGIGAMWFEVPGPGEYWADLDLAGEGGAGTELDPWHADTFKANAYQTLFDESVINVKGSVDYGVTSFQLAAELVGETEGKVNLVAWGTDPFRIHTDNGMYLHGDIKQGILQSPSSIGLYDSETIDTYIKSGDLLSIHGTSATPKGCTFIAPTIGGGSSDVVNAVDTIFSYTYFNDYPGTFVTSRCLFTGDAPPGTHVNQQENWTPPAWPDWDDAQSAFSSNILSFVNIPPEPGTVPYTGYETGLWGESRLGIGALYFEPPYGMHIDLKDDSTGVVDTRVWEVLNRLTMLYEPLGTTEELTNKFFNMFDATYVLYDGEAYSYSWELRLTVSNDAGSDTKDYTFTIIDIPR